MPPRKLINKSRGVGSRKRPPKAPVDTTPKTDSVTVLEAPETPKAPVTTTHSNGTKSASNAVVVPLRKAESYTNVSQVPHGLSLPTFDPNHYFTTDLFTDSSPLSRTTKEDADKLIESIEEKRQTIRVVTANLGLNQDIVRAGNEKQKLEGLAIDYATTTRNNETKFVNWQTAEINTDIAENRFDQAQERLVQGKAVLTGMQAITPLITEEWQQRKSLKQSQINTLKVAATQAKEAIEPKLLQISESFRQDLDEVG